MERRDRLKKIVAERGDDAAAALDGAPVTGAMVVEEAAVVQKELFHTEGPPELQQARLDIARWSLKRARNRGACGGWRYCQKMAYAKIWHFDSRLFKSVG
jgi:hypothetical protein